MKFSSKNLRIFCVIIIAFMTVGILPTVSDASAVAVDIQSSSLYLTVRLELANFEYSCVPDYKQQTVVVTQQEFNTLAKFEREFGQSNVTQLEGLCVWLTALGGPPFAPLPHSAIVNIMVVGYVVGLHLSLNNQLPMKVTNVRGATTNNQTGSTFHEIYCAPRCSFDGNVSVPISGTSTSPITAVVLVDTEVPVGWGIPPFWFQFIWIPKTYQTSVSIAVSQG